MSPLLRAAIVFVSLVTLARAQEAPAPLKLAPEALVGEGVWTQPGLAEVQGAAPVVVWFETQLLGDGKAYLRRAKALAGRKRSEVRAAALETLRAIHKTSWEAAKPALDPLVTSGALRDVRPSWIVNGFRATATPAGVAALAKVPGVKKIFAAPQRRPARQGPAGKSYPVIPAEPFAVGKYKRPWYVRSLLADKVWTRFGVTGEGTLNVIHDFNFFVTPNLTAGVYRNPKEIADNGKDDDGNGLIDDVHGYNFNQRSGRLQTAPRTIEHPQLMHGFSCAAIVCGRGSKGFPYAFGLAPRGRWAGVIANPDSIEDAVQWAALQGADTYSMSFSMPGLGEYRSHWRKLMEQGSLCGIIFVSGAGNFAQKTRVPVQMRIPEDIPEAVFAAAGVQRDLSRTPFSSQGPVEWKTEHYRDGRVQKPEVCAFNMNLPRLRLNGQAQPGGLNGNSFAGPMFCGALALLLSADPELLPWDLKAIAQQTAMDVGPEGVDHQTGHGLLNCYRAVKEVLRRKAIREGKDPAPYTGREEGDQLAPPKATPPTVTMVQPRGQGARAGIKVGDVILRYDGKPIADRPALIAAKRAAAAKAEVVLVVKRGDEELELKLAPGALGVGIGTGEPVFK